MSELTTPEAQTLSVGEAYLAAHLFLEAYWERGGKRSDDLAILLGSMELLEARQPLDAALWEDFSAAAAKAKAVYRSRLS